jgi:hypothetical protein
MTGMELLVAAGPLVERAVDLALEAMAKRGHVARAEANAERAWLRMEVMRQLREEAARSGN